MALKSNKRETLKGDKQPQHCYDGLEHQRPNLMVRRISIFFWLRPTGGGILVAQLGLSTGAQQWDHGIPHKRSLCFSLFHHCSPCLPSSRVFEIDGDSKSLSSIPGLGRSPGEGKGYALQYSGLENSMDCIVYGVAKSRRRLSDFHFHFTS